MAKELVLQPLAASYLPAVSGAMPISVPLVDMEIEISVWLRRKPDCPSLPDIYSEQYVPIDRKEFADKWGAQQADLDAVVDYVKSVDPKIRRVGDNPNYPDLARRLVRLKGTVKSLQDAFGVVLKIVRPPRKPAYFVRTGDVQIPSSLRSIVLGVFGLDGRPIGTRGRPVSAAGMETLAATTLPTPPQIAERYKFPKIATCKGQTIALMQFGGGYDPAHPQKYFTDLSVKQPTLVDVSILGTTNTSDPEYDNEVTLDIEVAGAVAEEATLVTYFAPHNEAGWIEAIASAVHDATHKPGIMSISWGAAELGTSNTLTWSEAGMQAMSDRFLDAACLGMTVLAASGDDGANCRVNDWYSHVPYPASDPRVLACGGTSIADYAGAPGAEIAWRFGGGGVSDCFPVPTYQDAAWLPMSRNTMLKARSVPDIAGYAAPGYRFWVGHDEVLAGTSLVAPLYAGAIARLNAKNHKLSGFIHHALYTFPMLRRDIDDAQSNNTSNGIHGAPGYYGNKGWDARTGLGIFEPGAGP
jgi:kumamolisin